MKKLFFFPSFLILLGSFNCSFSTTLAFNLPQKRQPNLRCLALSRPLSNSYKKLFFLYNEPNISSLNDHLTYQPINQTILQRREDTLKKAIFKLEYSLQKLKLESEVKIHQEILNRKCPGYRPNFGRFR
jgi:hypothetical protein